MHANIAHKANLILVLFLCKDWTMRANFTFSPAVSAGEQDKALTKLDSCPTEITQGSVCSVHNKFTGNSDKHLQRKCYLTVT